MTSTLGRFYSTAVALVVFFLSWAVIAARPWVAPRASEPDPRLAQLQARERRLQTEATNVQKLLDKRWAAYRVALAQRERQIATRKLANAAAIKAAAKAARATAAAAAPVYAAPAPTTRAPSVRVAPAAPPVATTKTS